MDGSGRWYRRQRAWFHQRPTVPPRPFTPRSLVGMTMGARKRRAAVDFWRGLQPYECARKLPTDPATKRFDLKCALTSCLGNTKYQAARAKYHIGERLRPCQGCLQCQPKDCEGCGFTLGSSEECEPCEAHAVERYVYSCDGSGVLPARKS